jgi:hypothetical protein
MKSIDKVLWSTFIVMAVVVLAVFNWIGTLFPVIG